MKIDGDLSEFKDSFCTPVNYFHPQVGERAAQFFYMWDDEAFYAGLRTLDTKQTNHAPDGRLWEGDAVEWYFDTRRDENFRGLDGGKGAVHCYWTGYNKTEVAPRSRVSRLSRLGPLPCSSVSLEWPVRWTKQSP
jgi:hypothetical protein